MYDKIAFFSCVYILPDIIMSSKFILGVFTGMYASYLYDTKPYVIIAEKKFYESVIYIKDNFPKKNVDIDHKLDHKLDPESVFEMYKIKIIDYFKK